MRLKEVESNLEYNKQETTEHKSTNDKLQMEIQQLNRNLEEKEDRYATLEMGSVQERTTLEEVNVCVRVCVCVCVCVCA
jgi:uncharacterized protein YigA (DUF484 family)